MESATMRSKLEKYLDGMTSNGRKNNVRHSIFNGSSKNGIEIADSPYVVVNMRILSRVSSKVLEYIKDNGDFVSCAHSVTDVPWTCNPENTFIAHFPETREIISFGSCFGGNALLSNK